VGIPGVHVSCGRGAVVLHGANDMLGPERGTYGRTWFVDVAGRSVRRIDDPAACRRS
jgi:hypothetical protein